MKLHVFDFDGTIFRSPVPHPQLGDDWIDWIQGATVEGMGLGYFQEPETLGQLAGVPENPTYVKQKHDNDDTENNNNNNNSNTNFFIQSTIEKAHKAKADGDHVVVMTGRSQYFLPRIRHLLKCCQFPTEDVYAKVDEKAGTVKYKANEICKIVRNLNRGLNRKNVAITDVVLYDDRPEQVDKIATRLCENLSAPWPPPGFIIRGVPATPGTTNGSGCQTIPTVNIVHVRAPDLYIASAEMENKLLWKILSKVKERLGPIREIVNKNKNSNTGAVTNPTTTTNNNNNNNNNNPLSVANSATSHVEINNTNELQLVMIGSVDEEFFGRNSNGGSAILNSIDMSDRDDKNKNNSNNSKAKELGGGTKTHAIKLEDLLMSGGNNNKNDGDDDVDESDKGKNGQNNSVTTKEAISETKVQSVDDKNEDEIIIMDPKEVLLNSLRNFQHLMKFVLEN